MFLFMFLLKKEKVLWGVKITVSVYSCYSLYGLTGKTLPTFDRFGVRLQDNA